MGLAGSPFSGSLTQLRQQMLRSLLASGGGQGAGSALFTNLRRHGAGAPPGYPQQSPNMYAPGLTALASGADWPRRGPAEPSWAAAYYGAQHPAAAPQAAPAPVAAPPSQMANDPANPASWLPGFYPQGSTPFTGTGGVIGAPPMPQSVRVHSGGHAVYRNGQWVDPIGGGVYT